MLKSVLIMALEVLCYGFCITICPGGSRALNGSNGTGRYDRPDRQF